MFVVCIDDNCRGLTKGKLYKVIAETTGGDGKRYYRFLDDNGVLATRFTTRFTFAINRRIS